MPNAVALAVFGMQQQLKSNSTIKHISLKPVTSVPLRFLLSQGKNSVIFAIKTLYHILHLP